MVALGKKTVAVAGTPVQVYASSATLPPLRARTILIKCPITNAGTVWVGRFDTMVKATGVAIIGDIPPGGSLVLATGADMAFVDTEGLGLDADNNNDVAFVTVIS